MDRGTDTYGASLVPHPGAIKDFKNFMWISFVVAARFIARGRSGEATYA
jgi:hypothetical protein